MRAAKIQSVRRLSRFDRAFVENHDEPCPAGAMNGPRGRCYRPGQGCSIPCKTSKKSRIIPAVIPVLKKSLGDWGHVGIVEYVVVPLSLRVCGCHGWRKSPFRHLRGFVSAVDGSPGPGWSGRMPAARSVCAGVSGWAAPRESGRMAAPRRHGWPAPGPPPGEARHRA